MSEYQTLRIEREGSVAAIILARPELYNRLDLDAHFELEAALAEMAADPSLRALIIGGDGKHFSAGGDLRELAMLRDNPERRRRMFAGALNLVQTYLAIRAPIIVALQGEATGLGASIAALGDILVMCEQSGICDPHVAVGLVAGDGGCLAWPMAMGLNRAKRYLLTGDRLGGKEAFDMGLATELVDSPDLVRSRAWELADKVAALPPLAVQGTKRALNGYAATVFSSVFERALEIEEQTMMSEDVGEVIDAMQQRRKPVFSGK